jgi:hypothetical protein
VPPPRTRAAESDAGSRLRPAAQRAPELTERRGQLRADPVGVHHRQDQVDLLLVPEFGQVHGLHVTQQPVQQRAVRLGPARWCAAANSPLGAAAKSFTPTMIDDASRTTPAIDEDQQQDPLDGVVVSPVARRKDDQADHNPQRIVVGFTSGSSPPWGSVSGDRTVQKGHSTRAPGTRRGSGGGGRRRRRRAAAARAPPGRGRRGRSRAPRRSGRGSTS